MNSAMNAIVADTAAPADSSSVDSAAGAGSPRTKLGSGRFRIWICLGVLVVLAAFGLSPAWMSLYEVWRNDPLRSVGVLVVLAGGALALREWERLGWELHGTWWGLCPLLLAYAVSESRLNAAWLLIFGSANLNLLSPGLSLYLFASGVMLLFAGPRVWRQAWFPLGLLLLAQPVPAFASQYLDLPLQNLSARVARSFASSIGFPAANRELLRLMFNPAFGMFIAPGCDGLRGAVTMGYTALIAGYLKRVAIPRWILYVSGAVLLGYLFNLCRLCFLVVYYRIALGDPFLESVARHADYAIGGLLMGVAATLLLWILTRQPGDSRVNRQSPQPTTGGSDGLPATAWRIVAFSILALLAASLGVLHQRDHQKSLADSVRDGEISPNQLDELLPKQVGAYRLNRTWQEQSNGRTTLEAGAYERSGSDEVILGIWLPPGRHTLRESWKTHGEDPQFEGKKQFLTSRDVPVVFDTSFYSDGVVNSIAGDVICAPKSCLPASEQSGVRLFFTTDPTDFTTRGARAISIFFRLEMPCENVPQAVVESELVTEAQKFLHDADLSELSRRFQ